jgi:hypothetical protein
VLAEDGAVQTWVELADVNPPFVSFHWQFVFEADGAVLTSDSTLRFRGRAEIEKSLNASGFEVEEVRDAPDRPGREFVFIAKRVADPRGPRLNPEQDLAESESESQSGFADPAP